MRLGSKKHQTRKRTIFLLTANEEINAGDRVGTEEKKACSKS